MGIAETVGLVAMIAILGAGVILVMVRRVLRLLYPMQIRIVTTSDWTTLRLVGSMSWAGPVEITQGQGVQVAEFDGAVLRLTQTCDRPEACKTVEMVAKMSLLNPDLFTYIAQSVGAFLGWQLNVAFEIERGHWGWTHVQMSNCLGDKPVVMENYWWCGITPGPRNVRTIETPISGLFDSPSPNPPPALGASSLTDKTLFGYQGWFACSGWKGDCSDFSERDGWIHWFKMNPPKADNLSVDFWPDMSELESDECFVTGMVLPGGIPPWNAAKLFSSYKQKTVVRHFRWMEEYGIDGVFLQRFVSGLEDPRVFCFRNQVTQNVQLGAERHGRVFAIMYDISGQQAGYLKGQIKRDWTFMVEVLKITESPNYLHHNGRPVVGVWGFGFNDSRHQFAPVEAMSIIDWFHNGAPDHCKAVVVGGVPTHWRTLDGDSRSYPDWGTVYRSFDIICPWTVGRFRDIASADAFKTNFIVPDMADASASGVGYLPVIWPGFSWHNLFPDTDLNMIPRNGGSLYKRQAYNAISAGARMLYVAMFDEVDEGTAMFKLAPTASQLPLNADLVPLDKDGYHLPSDWYLQLGGVTCRMLRGEIPVTDWPPMPPKSIQSWIDDLIHWLIDWFSGLFR